MRTVWLAVLLALLLVPAAQAQDENVLRIGWSQDPRTLSPFVDLDEEDFSVWALNWDFLVNVDPDDLSPAPGLAESWDVSEDGRTVTFHLVEGARWSDGEPITSEDVKWSLETLGSNGPLFSSYTENVESITTPDDSTVVIETSKPDTRIVGGLLIYILPEHIWGDVPVKRLTGSYKPDMPLVGSGPYIATEFERNRIIRMERNPEFRGPAPKFREIQFIKYGSADAVTRALTLGEVDLVEEVPKGAFERLGRERNIETIRSPSPEFTQLAFNLCERDRCPDARLNPAVQDRAVRQAVAFAVDRERINEIAARGTSFVGHGLLPEWYRSFYEVPAEDYPFDPARAEALLDEAGYVPGEDGIRAKGDTKLSFDLAVRSEDQSNVQAARLVAEMAREVGIEFKVDVMSTDRLTEITTRRVDDKPAPEFDTFIWGWGGDAYDPSFLLNLLTSDAIDQQLSDAFYSNPEYDRLFSEQSGEFDAAARKEIIGQMIAIAQRDLPYLVLTVDPGLQAYRTDRIASPPRACPAETGDLWCAQVSYEPALTLAPASAETAAATSDDGGTSGLVYVLIAVGVAALALVAFLVIRRRRAKGEALEV
jgi:peptide/nickel transport system substrate-binding protein